MSLHPRGGGRSLTTLTLIVASALASACAHPLRAGRVPAAPLTWQQDAIAWVSPSDPGDADALARWRGAVGPPVVQYFAAGSPAPSTEITVVAWNVANGAGDVVRFARTLKPGAPVVLLLQEAFRGGPEVPSTLTPTAAFAGRLGGAGSADCAIEIEAVADALDLNLYYVPSMRNGGPSSDEDRGNAILTNLPLTELAAVELPFERQRRVAIAATVLVPAPGGSRRVRVASVHLDTVRGFSRGWIASTGGRVRQARLLRDVLAGSEPTVLGGDFNTWRGVSEPAYVETARDFPQTTLTDARPTFRGLLKLDHLFFRLPAGWRGAFHRADDRFGSDHFPLVGLLRIR